MHSLIEKVRGATTGYFTAQEKLEAELKAAEADYQGERRQKETARIHALQKDAHDTACATVVKACHEASEAYRVQKENRDADGVNPKNITPDFELLKQLVTLTADELRALHARNADNALFTRALRQYAGERNIQVGFPDVLDEKMRAVNELYGAYSRPLQTRKKALVGIAEAALGLERIDAILSKP